MRKQGPPQSKGDLLAIQMASLGMHIVALQETQSKVARSTRGKYA